MATYPAESFYRGTIRQSIANNTSVPFTLKVSKIPTLTSGLLTISPNTANEEIIEYSGVDGTALTITVVKRGISPSAQALLVNGADYNNATYQTSHSQNDTIRGDVNHLHIIQDYGTLDATKLNKSGGLRDTMGASRGALEIDATGAEVKKAIVDGSTIADTDSFRKRKTDGTYEEIAYSTFKGLLSTAGKYIQTVTLGEDVSGSTSIPMAVVGSIKYTPTGFASTAGSFINSGIRFTPTYDCTLGVVKTNANASSGSAQVFLQSDTGTTLATRGVTNGTNTTASFDYALTAGTTYRLVVNDTVNFGNNKRTLAVATYQSSFPYAISGVTNGVTDSVSCLNFTEINLDYGNKAFKARADKYIERGFSALAGFILAPGTKGASVTLDGNNGTLVTSLSGLTVDTPYYISNTAGTLSTSAGTVPSRVGYAKSTTTLQISKEYVIYDVTYANPSAGSTAYSNTFTATKNFFAILVSYTPDSGGGGGGGLQIESTNMASNTTIQLPYFGRIGQVVRAYGSNGVGNTGAGARIQVFYNE